MTLAYVAGPYTRYKPGLEAAYRDACALTARLILSGVNAFSPIAHAHGIAIHGQIDPRDQQFWKECDAAMLDKCDVLIVAHMAPTHARACRFFVC
jgi:nucleoside 2-deoxyribosyltransferase